MEVIATAEHIRRITAYGRECRVKNAVKRLQTLPLGSLHDALQIIFSKIEIAANSGKDSYWFEDTNQNILEHPNLLNELQPILVDLGFTVKLTSSMDGEYLNVSIYWR